MEAMGGVPLILPMSVAFFVIYPISLMSALEANSIWSLEADQESAALLTFSWPEELARV